MARLEVVILAAGQGTRMRSSVPKVLHKIAGRSMLEHVIAATHQLDAQAIHVVYGHGGEAVPSAIADDNINWILQAERNGTGHAVRTAMPGVEDESSLLVLYGDAPLVNPDTLRRAVATAESGEVAIVTAHAVDPTGYGRILRDASGSVTAIREQKDASPDEQAVTEFNSGFMAAPSARLRGWLNALRSDNAQGELYLTDVVELAIADGVPVTAVVADNEAEIAGVNDRGQLAQLERVYQSRMADHLMRSGVTLADPARIDIRGELVVGEDVEFDINVIIEGAVQIGSGCRIGPNCLIRASTLGNNIEVLANTIIDGATVGDGAKVGPFARLRPEAELGANVRVGNFVEIKKSVLSEGAKVNHLTYVGDSDIGARVNIGAGTITCNYDGANKHRTVIGDDAFIGSGTQLVAPVTVGAGATIGAGSTIGSNVPDGALTLTRAKLRTIDGWKRPIKQK